MRAYSNNYAGAKIVTDIRENDDGDLVTTVSPSVATRAHESFSFGGFGPGDRIHPVSGNLTKHLVTYPHGSHTFTYDVPGFPYVQTRMEGVLDDVFSMTGPVVDDPDVSRLVELAVSKVNEEIRNQYANLGTDAAESGQTRQSFDRLRDSAGNLGQSMHNLRNNLRTVSAASRAAADAWLEWHYGIIPVVQEMAHIVAHQVTPEITRVRKAMSRKSASAGRATSSTNGGSVIIIRTDSQVEVRVECCVYYGITSPAVYELHKVLDFNPLATYYESIGLSFVLDWVLDIGQYLRNVEAQVGFGVSFVSGYITTTRRALDSYSFSYSGPLAGGTLLASGSAREETRSKSRAVYTGFPAAPRPTFHRPFDLGSDRIISAGSLLRQRI